MTRTKRSRSVHLALLGAAAFGVAGCKDERVEAQAFPDLASCTAAAADAEGWYSPLDCEAAFAQAEAAHAETAPRYDEMALCEEQHDGACTEVAGTGGGGVFMPLMMGYMMGSMLSNGRNALAAQPLYRAGSGQYATAGGTTLDRNTGTATVRPAAFRPAPSTATAAPMSRATVKATGGFGAARTSVGSRTLGG